MPLSPKDLLRRHAQATHGWAALLWLAFAPVVVTTELKKSIEFLVFISIYAVVVGHWSGWSAERD